MLDGADAEIEVVGRATAGRPFPLAEIDRTLDAGKLLLPVFVDPFDEPRRLHEFMAANTDVSGGIAYLQGLKGEQLAQVVARTVERILQVLATVVTRNEEQSGLPTQASNSGMAS